MYTLEIAFKNYDQQGALFPDDTPIEWFITKNIGDKVEIAVLSDTNNTDKSKISIQIENDVASAFDQTKDLKPVPIIYFHYKIGDAVSSGIQIKLIHPLNPNKNFQSVKGSNIGAKTITDDILPLTLPKQEPVVYDLTANNKTDWDWIMWETEGNSGPPYRRGGKTRKLGLYRMNYDKLRKAGKDEWQEPHKDKTMGGGWVKIVVLDSLDYSEHQELIKTFLPSFQIDGKKVKEPNKSGATDSSTPVAKSEIKQIQPNTLDTAPPLIVMPFNYDDNGSASNAIGKDLESGLFPKVETKRLELELTRWATASRSTITAFPKPLAQFWRPAKDNQWLLRPEPKAGLEEEPYFPDSWRIQITGPTDGQTLCNFQKIEANNKTRYYSVKTGVEFVSTVSQSGNNKDRLEENSIHAMNRSNLITATIQRLGEGKFEARYQVEVLCILLLRDPEAPERVALHPDGLENNESEKPESKRRKSIAKELNDALVKRTSEWNPFKEEFKKQQKIDQSLENHEEMREAGIKLAQETKEKWRDIQTVTDKETNTAVWKLISEISVENFLELSDNKILMDGLAETNPKDFENYDDFAREITRLKTSLEVINEKQFTTRKLQIEDEKLKLGFDGIQVREVTDAAANEVWFPALAIPTHGKAFVESWAAGQNWVKFWKDNYAVPMGRAKGEMLLHFGMQHMTSNAQNFLIAFDRQSGGATGKLKHIILRDIGDTLYNDHVFAVLNEFDPLFEKEFSHESGDKEFGVTLSSALGSYTMPRMLRIGASIVFLFGPFVQGEIAASDNCFKILADWCIAHNRAFLDYMKEKIGYSETWSGDTKHTFTDLENFLFDNLEFAGSHYDNPQLKDKVYDLSTFLKFTQQKGGYSKTWSNEDYRLTDFEDFLFKNLKFVISLYNNPELNKKNDEKYGDIVVPGVLKLNSEIRWRLILRFEEECRKLPLARAPNAVVSAKTVKLVNAHEVLICAEIQSYILSEAGKKALRALHLGKPSSHTSKPEPKLTLEKFKKLYSGMPYENVVEMLGFKGVDITPKSGPSDVTVFQWKDDEREISVIFNFETLHNVNQKNLQ